MRIETSKEKKRWKEEKYRINNNDKIWLNTTVENWGK
jgi:hypothetical protein